MSFSTFITEFNILSNSQIIQQTQKTVGLGYDFAFLTSSQVGAEASGQETALWNMILNYNLLAPERGWS